MITVWEFCFKKTDIHELIVIREDGWIRHTVWIDSEDIFVIHPDYANRRVKSDSWGTLVTRDKDGNRVEVSCHYLDI